MQDGNRVEQWQEEDAVGSYAEAIVEIGRRVKAGEEPMPTTGYFAPGDRRMTNLPPDLDDAVGRLRAKGWIVEPPPSDKIPDPRPGEVWRCARPKVEPRTVIAVGPHRSYPETETCISFASPSRPPHEKYGPHTIHIHHWRSWARRTGARPA